MKKAILTISLFLGLDTIAYSAQETLEFLSVLSCEHSQDKNTIMLTCNRISSAILEKLQFTQRSDRDGLHVSAYYTPESTRHMIIEESRGWPRINTTYSYKETEKTTIIIFKTFPCRHPHITSPSTRTSTNHIPTQEHSEPPLPQDPRT